MPADLAAMLPGYFQDVVEFQEIMSAENMALDALERSIARVRDNNYVLTGDESTAALYEELLNLVPRPGESLEYRKRVILNRLSLRLPYSLPRLRELLDAAVGREGYELWVRHQDYELELNIIDQDWPVLLDLRSVVREMIPAHLILAFAGRYRIRVPVEIRHDSRLNLRSEFYARYNLAFLYLDGTWSIDGTYNLNGYKELIDFDLYPSALRILSGITEEWNIGDMIRFQGGVMHSQSEESRLTCRGEAEVSQDTVTGMAISGIVEAGTGYTGILVVQGSAGRKAVSSSGVSAVSSAAVSPETVSETVRMKAEGLVPTVLDSEGRITGGAALDQRVSGGARAVLYCVAGPETVSEAVRLRAAGPVSTTAASAGRIAGEAGVAHETAAGTRMASACAAVPSSNSRAGYSSSWNTGVSYGNQLRVERNLWYLDGTHLLDGSRKLNAAVFQYEL